MISALRKGGDISAPPNLRNISFIFPQRGPSHTYNPCVCEKSQISDSIHNPINRRFYPVSDHFQALEFVNSGHR